MSMNTILLFFSLVLVFSLTSNSAKAPSVSQNPYVRFRAQIPNRFNHTQFLKMLNANGFDLAGVNFEQMTVDIVTDDQGIKKLMSRGLKGEVVSTSVSFQVDKRYLNPSTLLARMQSLAQANPNLTQLMEIGKTNQGRGLMGLLVSTTPDINSPEYFQKPTIIFDGLHHAREVMTVEVVLDVAETILKNSRSRFSQELLKKWNVWIVPMVNPDGSNIVFTANSMWRKNARAGASDIFGVDVNRNYSYRWGDCQGSSANKDSQTYRGANAASEPETQAMIKLADLVHPTASLSYHSYGELVLFPYGCQGDVTAENALVQRIANELAAILPTDNGRSNYRPGTPWQILYGVDGDSMDYMFAAHGALAYTFEINQDFQPDYSLRDATVAKHRKAWMFFLDRLSKNLLTVNVIDGQTGVLSEAVMAVDSITPNKKEWPFRTNRIGKYFKVLDPGKYVISAKLKDGRRGQIQVQMQAEPQTVNLTVD
jgi:carboxypeptidase T